MVVLYALNRKLYEELPMSLNSLFINNPDCKVYVMCEDDSIPTVTDKRVTFLNINNYPEYKIHSAYDDYVLSKMTFVRLWIAEYLPESRIIWLDVDTIIDGPLDELWNLDMGNKVVAGAFDACPDFSGIGGLYINAGVLVIDLDKWRKYGFTKKVQDLLKEKVFRLADQDAINVACKGYIKYLDLKWNYQINQPAQTYIKNPIITHYAAHPKILESLHVKHAMKYYTDHI